MPTRPDEAVDRVRRLMHGGGLLVVLLAVVVVLLPILVLSVDDARAPSSSVQEPAVEPPHPETPAIIPTPPQLSSEADSAPETTRSSGSTVVDQVPASRPAPPIIERRRVQKGRAPPSGEQAQEPDASAAGEWDRSDKARRRRVARFGGTPRTESAVEAGLAWLAAHQAPDGTWDRFRFDRQCPAGDRCPGVALRRDEYSLRAGVSGLALLAFLGAGYTDREGPHQDVVHRAVDALVALQQAQGGFSSDDGMAGYNDSLATLALAEYVALTGEARVRAPLERAVARLVASQQALGGWDYGRSPTSGRSDTSITAWMVQALHASAVAGIAVPPNTLVHAALHFARATEPDGQVRYADAGSGFSLDENLRPVYRRGPAMLAAGLTCEQMLGWRLDGPTPLRQRDLILEDPPSAARARGRDPSKLHNEYYWYYGTLAMFQRGGGDWQRWNARLRDAILPLQDRTENAAGQRRHTYGSWRPYGPNWGLFGRMGSRVYTTAICTLTLEIYYRHTPAFLKDDILFSADDWRALLAGADARQRFEAVGCLAQLRVEVAEPVLVVLLKDEQQRVALAAAAALARLDSPLGVPLLDEVITTLPPWQRAVYQEALKRGQAVATLPLVAGRVRFFEPQAGRATLDLPRSYVGMKVVVYRNGQAVAHMRVLQRFTGRTVVVAQLVEEAGSLAPRAGDRVVGR